MKKSSQNKDTDGNICLYSHIYVCKNHKNHNNPNFQLSEKMVYGGSTEEYAKIYGISSEKIYVYEIHSSSFISLHENNSKITRKFTGGNSAEDMFFGI